MSLQSAREALFKQNAHGLLKLLRRCESRQLPGRVSLLENHREILGVNHLLVGNQEASAPGRECQ